MLKGGGASSIPALQALDDTWGLTPDGKAKLFADAFSTKSHLPVKVANEFSNGVAAGGVAMSGFLPLRQRSALRFLKGLREDSATGPDLLPTRVLKRCAACLALPVCLLARMAAASGQWPALRKTRWLLPLYKKHARHRVANYKGIHLTSQLSKVVERMLAAHLLGFLEKCCASRQRQFAYRRGRGYRDALAHCMLTWIWALGIGKRVAVYCSDVSGAFDRVSSDILLEKLKAYGIHADLLRMLRAWLAD